MDMNKKKTKNLPRIPIKRKDSRMVMYLDALRMVRSYKSEWKLATQLEALEGQQSLTGIRSLHKIN